MFQPQDLVNQLHSADMIKRVYECEHSPFPESRYICGFSCMLHVHRWRLMLFVLADMGEQCGNFHFGILKLHCSIFGPITSW